jgi:tripartite-type tricarboxylate transporter receptor subunit TctC
MKRSRRAAAAVLLACVSIAWSPLTQAQDKYPSKPIRLVVPFAAGGPGDILARLLASQLPTQLGQNVIVDNRPGANGETGTENAARSPPDGYTILQVSTVQTISMALQEKLRYDLLRDFEPVSYAFEAPLVLVTPGSSPVRTVPALIAAARSRREGLSYGTGGVGTVGHLTAELFKRSAGITAVNVPYKGNGAAMGDLIGGRLDFYFATVAESQGNVKNGRLNALAVTSRSRVQGLPDTPTMAESGFPTLTPLVTWGFMVPKGTPAPIVKQLHEAIAKSIALPALQERLHTLGVTANVGDGNALATSIHSDLVTWRQVIRSANIQPE